MSIRAITNNQSKGLSEHYRQSDIKVTGYYIYKKVEIFLFAMLVILLTGCGGGGGGSTASYNTGGSLLQESEDPSIEVVEIPLVSKAVQQGHITDSLTGKPLANVDVSIGSQTATTDANGLYTLSNLTETEEAVINFEKEGYLLGSTQIQLKSLSGDDTTSSNYLEFELYTHDYQFDHDSSEEIAGGAIAIDASYIDTKGNPYNGTMAVKLTILDNDEEALLTAFPGTFKGINSNGTLVQFESYGLISISLNDSEGNELRFADGEAGTLIFTKVSSQEKPNTLPLWYYDYDQGLWVEEGYAELQEDGSYRGEISHLGTWSLNRVLEDEAGIYRGRIIDEDGSPMSDVRLQAIGENWISNDLSTDEDGVFEIEVIPGEDFKLKAYHYEDKFGAESGTISAVASGEIIEI